MSTVKFGVTLPYGDARKSAQQAKLAEDAGWDEILLGDAIWCLDPMIQLAASAMTTRSIRLGTMVLAMPLRRPWHLASESTAIDILSDGRLILGLGTGATWMGWQGFPDEVIDTKARAEMLDEAIDILTMMYEHKPFDYAGKHYHIKLTLVDEVHYPPVPVQQPRVPVWIPGVWPRMKSMQRVLKCDGLFPEKMNSENRFEDVKPADLREMKAYVDANRKLSTPFDLVIQGMTADMDKQQIEDKISPWIETGMTWWVEGLWGKSEEDILKRIRQGPPMVSKTG